ncbi:MAG TPA: response regulator transcription factor [Candidatus Limnocylindrales bacterium]|nr:response regulator transcription factor [Candidatus Limnocylindrales bacterium]
MIRLVIVDDHEMVREGLKTILQTEPDFQIVGEAATARDLVTLAERTRADVVLLDARLPDGSGPDGCRRLTAEHPDVKVLIVSTFSDDDLVDEYLRAGAHGYVIKNIERFSLKQSIRAVYRGEGAVSPEIARRLIGRVREQDTKSHNKSVLNKSQIEILRLVSQGLSNREIGARVHLSENTVKTHLQEIFDKLEVRNRVEAALRATRGGLI